MLVIHNARIHTQNPIQESATALAVDHGNILAVGTDDDILYSFPTGNTFDVHGCSLIPGLTDAHIHLENYALSLQKVDCETPNKSECLQKIAHRVLTAQPGEWILGHGWNQNAWDDGYGCAKQLDDVAPNNPIYLTHKSLHCAWVNSVAMNIAGIDRNTPNPASGLIGHLSNGEPDGILFENSMNLVENVIPEPSLEQVVHAIRSAQPILWKMGLTGVHDFDYNRCFSALQVMHNSSELKLRVLKSIPLENLNNAIDLGLHSGFGNDMLRIGSVKLFSDGALGPHTAAMLQPYEDDPQNMGILMLDAEQLLEYGQLAVRNGINLAVHAIGDRANHEVLNAYVHLRELEHFVQKPFKAQLRHRIEHVQVLHPDDVSRLSELNIIASMQPIHATSDMVMADQFWGKRAVLAYAWREQITRGAKLIFGSDAPVESPNPFWGIHAAVSRRRADGSPSIHGWYPEQRLSINEALQAYTTGPAFAAGIEDKVGKLEPGYWADLIILNKDPFSCLPDDLLNIYPLATMVGGEWVYSELE
jgi:predicted amidohydrolase YtcJ